MILTSNTEATENKVEFLNYAYMIKGFQCQSNNLLQLFELKEKKQQQNNTCYLNVFFVVFFSYVVAVKHNALTQLDIHLHETYLRG